MEVEQPPAASRETRADALSMRLSGICANRRDPFPGHAAIFSLAEKARRSSWRVAPAARKARMYSRQPSSEASTMFLSSAAPMTLPEGGIGVTPGSKERGACANSAYSVTSPAICCLSAAARGESDTGFAFLRYNTSLDQVECRGAAARPMAGGKRRPGPVCKAVKAEPLTPPVFKFFPMFLPRRFKRGFGQGQDCRMRLAC